MENNRLLKKLTAGIVIFAVLCICFCITTFALIYAMVTVEDNVFTTGTVDINLNGGAPIVYDPNLYLEPGMTIEKTFFIKNEGSVDLYFKLYFDRVEGGLGDVIDVSIIDEGIEIYKGKPNELSRFDVESAVKPLAAGEERTLTIVLNYPEDATNLSQNQSLSFDLHADAVQQENNDPTNVDFGDTQPYPLPTPTPQP